MLSLIKPIRGSVTASHSFATVIMVEATAIATPIVVIYLSIMHDISETPPPSIKPPIPYATFSREGIRSLITTSFFIFSSLSCSRADYP